MFNHLLISYYYWCVLIIVIYLDWIREKSLFIIEWLYMFKVYFELDINCDIITYGNKKWQEIQITKNSIKQLYDVLMYKINM